MVVDANVMELIFFAVKSNVNYLWKMGTMAPGGVEYAKLVFNEVIPGMEKVINGGLI